MMIDIDWSSPTFWLTVCLIFYGVEAVRRYFRYQVNERSRKSIKCISLHEMDAVFKAGAARYKDRLVNQGLEEARAGKFAPNPMKEKEESDEN